jgi:eukaryotic-like serine/threonine-protein kinase
VGGTLATCILLELVFVRLPDKTSVFLTTILSLTYVLLGRSVVIPSRGRRSLALGLAASGVAGVGISYVNMGAMGSRSLEESALVWFWLGSKPILISTMLAALTSRVIYGLRQQVREARRLGQYLLEEQIGQGGMGRVFRARHAPGTPVHRAEENPP